MISSGFWAFNDIGSPLPVDGHTHTHTLTLTCPLLKIKLRTVVSGKATIPEERLLAVVG